MWIDPLQYLKACDDIYVGGDIASFPLKMIGGEHVTIGHWQLSHAHGEILEITCQLAFLSWLLFEINNMSY
jgi:hypothetical protein